MREVIYEFIISSHIHIIDPSPWPAIIMMRDGIEVELQKPVSGQTTVPLKETLGNVPLNVGYSIMRAVLHIPDGAPTPEWNIPFQSVRECLIWIRTGAGQYWVGILPSGNNIVASGSIIAKDGSYSNFGGFATPILVNPLSKDAWSRIGQELAAGRQPSVPDYLFADALLSFRDNDWMQTVIRLGVVAELELNAFIDDLLSLHDVVAQELYDEKKYRFDDKLKKVLAILGAESYQNHNPKWASELLRMYQLRGSAIHRAVCLVEEIDPSTKQRIKVPLGFKDASGFMFAVYDFLQWAKLQRIKKGIVTSASVGSLFATMGC